MRVALVHTSRPPMKGVLDLSTHRTSNVFEDAARVVSAEIRRIQDVSKDINRELDGLRWRGESATYFRRHARNQQERTTHSVEVMESLRTLLLRASDMALQEKGKAGVP